MIDILTASRDFVTVVVTVLFAIAELRPVDAQGLATQCTLGTKILVTGTDYGSAALFVGAVLAVLVIVALVAVGYAQRVGAPKLISRARRKRCKET